MKDLVLSVGEMEREILGFGWREREGDFVVLVREIEAEILWCWLE